MKSIEEVVWIRKHGLDICRIFACMLVVMIHTVMLFWDFDPSSATWAVYNLLAMSIRCGVPLFFMISGALLLSRESMDIKKHYRRTLRFLLLFLAWSAIYNLLDANVFHVWNKSGSLFDIILGGYYHLWFLPALILCYAALPLVHKVIYKYPRGAVILLGLFLFIVLPISHACLVSGTESNAGDLLYAFRLSHLRYLGYMLLGYWLYKKRPGAKALSALAVISLAAVLLFSRLNRQYAVALGAADDLYYDYFVLSTVLVSCFVFSLLSRIESIPVRLEKPLAFLSSVSFGVYLLHPLFIDLLRSLHLDFTRFNTFVFFPACYVSFLLLSLALTAAIKKIPFVKDLVS